MKYKRLQISVDLLFMMFSEGHSSPGYRVTGDGIPHDAKLVNVRHAWPNTVELLIESESFAEIKDCDEIPVFSPTCERVLVAADR